MAKIIKSSDPHAYEPYEHEPFDPSQLPSLAHDTEEMTPEMQVAAILQEARAEAEAKVREAYQEGLRRGVEAGRQEFQARVDQTVQALEQLSAELNTAKQQILHEFERELVEVAREIVKRILLREAWADEQSVLTIVRTALSHLAEKKRLVIRVHPKDLGIVRQERGNILEQINGIDQVEVVEDESVSPGGCIIESETAFLDGRLETQLSRILDVVWEIPCEPPPAP